MSPAYLQEPLELWDSRVRGLLLHITRTDARTWSVFFRCWAPMARRVTGRVPNEHSQAVTAIGERDLRAVARAEGWEPRINSHVYIDEVLADALALAWLYSPTPTPSVS